MFALLLAASDAVVVGGVVVGSSAVVVGAQQLIQYLFRNGPTVFDVTKVAVDVAKQGAETKRQSKQAELDMARTREMLDRLKTKPDAAASPARFDFDFSHLPPAADPKPAPANLWVPRARQDLD